MTSQTTNLRLQEACREIIDRAENSLPTESGLGQVADDYFVERLKKDEMSYAQVDPRYYEGLRALVRRKVEPLYAEYRRMRDQILERKSRRKVSSYVLGTVLVLELFELLVTRGRSFAPQLFLLSVIVNAFLGYVLYAATQYKEDVLLARARRRLENSLTALDEQMLVDLEYDQRRELMEGDLLKGEAVELVAQYDSPQDFWRDYALVRKADPAAPADLKTAHAPAFEKFLKFHVDGSLSTVARQNRYNRLFLEAQELFVARDRERYALEHLKPILNPYENERYGRV